MNKKSTLILLLALLLNGSMMASGIIRPFQLSTSVTELPGFDADSVMYLSTVQPELDKILRDSPSSFVLEMPYDRAGRTLRLELERTRVFDGAPQVNAIDQEGSRAVQVEDGLHYRGVMQGSAKSVVAISFFRNEIMGMVTAVEWEGNRTISKVKTDPSGTLYAFVSDQGLSSPMPIECQTKSQDGVDMPGGIPNQRMGTGSQNCVRLYLEADFQMYLDFGSNTSNVANYITALMNQSFAIFASENVNMTISEISVWTVGDPYRLITNRGDILTTFRSNRQTYNGDLAHLLSTRTANLGGVAFLDVLCFNPNGHAFSNIYTTFNTVPVYSWSVMVVTHEIGHNLGSNHTQWCGWTGGALDNCYTTEGGCPPGPAPTNGGTIMSYCHLTSYGINLANGFGQQPGDLIRSRVYNAFCLNSCFCAPSVSITASPAGVICTNTCVTFSASVTNGGSNPGYQWYVNGVLVGAGATYSSCILRNGDEVYCLLDSDAPCAPPGTVISNSVDMLVSSTLTPSITISTATNSVCSGSPVTFTSNIVNGGSSPTRQWLVNGVVSGTGPTFTTSSLINGNVVSCRLNSSYGCASPASVISTGITMVVSATVAPTVTISTSSTSSCFGTPVRFDATILNGGSNPFLEWYVNGSFVASGNSTFYVTSTLANGDRVECVVYSSSSCASPTFDVSNTITVSVGSSNNISTNGLLAWYPFNGNALDNSGNNFHGNFQSSGLGRDRFGSVNNSVVTNGVGGSVEVGSPPGINAISTGLTVSAWVFSGANNSSQTAIVSKWNFDIVNDQYLLWLYFGKPNFAIGNSTTGASGVQSPTALRDSVWYHLVGTWDNTGLHRIYINAALSASQSFPGFNVINNTSQTPLRIGTENGTYRAFKGQIDDVRIYNRVLNQQEILSLYNESTNAAIFIAPSANNVCQGTPIQFTSTLTGSGTSPSLMWYVNGVATNVTTPSFTSSTLNNGDIVTCQMISSDPCVSPNSTTSNAVSMRILPSIIQCASISTPTLSVCATDTVVFSTTLCDQSVQSYYQWFKNGSPIAGGNNSTLSITGLMSGDMIYCEVTSLAPCISPSVLTSNTLMITLSPPLNNSVSISANATNICPGQAAILTATPFNGGGSPTFNWYVNGNLQPGATGANFIYAPQNGDQVYCRMISSLSCVTPAQPVSNSILLTVLPNATAQVSLAGIPSLICSGDTVLVQANVVNGGSAPSFEWRVNGMLVQTTALPQFNWVNPINGDQLQCTMRSNDPCVSVPLVSSAISVASVIVAAIPVITSNGTTLTSSAAINYQWYVNGNLITGANGQQYTPLMNGLYNVMTTDFNGCEGFSNAFQFLTTGVSENSAGFPGTALFPNPADDRVILTLPEAKQLSVALFTVEGKFLGTWFDGPVPPGGTQFELSTRSIASGNYLLRLISDRTAGSLRLVVLH